MRRPEAGGTAGRNPRTGGFTLLEVVVALAILSAGILLLAELFRGSLSLSGSARDLSTAAVYASQRMEEALLSPLRAEEESGRFGDRYRWTVRATRLPAEEGVPFVPVRFDVAVRWEEGGSVRAVELSASRWDRVEGDAVR